MSDPDSPQPTDQEVTDVAERIVANMEPIIHEVIRELKLGGLYQSKHAMVESAFVSRLKIVANSNPSSGFWKKVQVIREASTTEAQFWARLRGYYREVVINSVRKRLPKKKRKISEDENNKDGQTKTDGKPKTILFSQLGDGKASEGAMVEALIVDGVGLKPVLTPDENAVVREDLNRVYQLLSADELSWLADHFVTDLSYREIAEANGVGTEAMKRRIYRVLDRIRDELGIKIRGAIADDSQT